MEEAIAAGVEGAGWREVGGEVRDAGRGQIMEDPVEVWVLFWGPTRGLVCKGRTSYSACFRKTP